MKVEDRKTLVQWMFTFGQAHASYVFSGIKTKDMTNNSNRWQRQMALIHTEAQDAKHTATALATAVITTHQKILQTITTTQQASKLWAMTIPTPTTLPNTTDSQDKLDDGNSYDPIGLHSRYTRQSQNTIMRRWHHHVSPTTTSTVCTISINY